MSEYVIVYRGPVPAPSADVGLINNSHIVSVLNLYGGLEEPVYLVTSTEDLTRDLLGLDENWIVSPNHKYNLL
jgi:hypothetical protein